MVARAAVTDRGAVRMASDQLRALRANVLGVVLNDVDDVRDGRYGRGYYSYHKEYKAYYGDEDTSAGSEVEV